MIRVWLNKTVSGWLDYLTRGYEIGRRTVGKQLLAHTLWSQYVLFGASRLKGAPLPWALMHMLTLASCL